MGYLEYRVYLPAAGDGSKIALPHITIENRGSTQQLRACTSHTTAIPPPVRQTTTTQATTPTSSRTSRPAPLEFFRAAFQTYFPNPETAYLLAYMTPPTASQVVVVTGKAPTFPPGAHPSIWPSASDQVRYWSMCVNIGEGTDPVVVNHLPGGQTDLGCRADDATKLSSGGTYTYVIGTEAQRTTIERVAGVTFLPVSLSQPAAPLYLLAMRYTLANPSFEFCATKRRPNGERPGGRSDHGGVLSARPSLLVERAKRRRCIGMWLVLPRWPHLVVAQLVTRQPPRNDQHTCIGPAQCCPSRDLRRWGASWDLGPRLMGPTSVRRHRALTNSGPWMSPQRLTGIAGLVRPVDGDRLLLARHIYGPPVWPSSAVPPSPTRHPTWPLGVRSKRRPGCM